MVMLKKLALAPLFLISSISLIYLTNPLFKSYDFIFSLSLDTLINLISISALISFSSLLFILFATIAQDWRISMPVAIIGSMIPFGFIDQSQALVFAVGIFVSLLLTNLNLDVILKSYLNFQPSSLLGPSIRHLSGLLILAICIVYFFSASKIIVQDGFQIPDSLIDTALKLTTSSLPNIQTEQASLSQSPANLANDSLKQTVKDQMQNFIKPYLNFIPAGLAILLFFTLQSLASIINLLVYPLLWLIFSILEKIGFVKFEVEQRPIKKLVV